MSPRSAIGATTAAVFVACLATSAMVPLFDPDEGYYPATALETAASGTLWDLRLGGEPRWDKPVLAYLLIEGAFAMFGPGEAAARLPSALEGAALVLIVGWLVSGLTTARAGALASVVVGSTLGLQIFARAAHPEIAVVLSIVTTELLICRWWAASAEHERLRYAAGAAVAVAYGILAKGPVAVVLPGLMVAGTLPFLWRSLPAARVCVRDGAIMVMGGTLLASPWYVAMTERHGRVFLEESLWQHNVVRYTSTQFGHRASILFFIVPTLVLMLPWASFVPGALRFTNAESSPAGRVVRLCMTSSAASAFVFYSLSGSKLANYALVLVPPLAVLVAMHLDTLLSAPAHATTKSERVSGASLLIVAAALCAVPLAVARGVNARVLLGGAPSRGADLVQMLWWGVLPTALVLGIGGLVVLVARRRVIRVATLAVAGTLSPLILLLSTAPIMHGAYPWKRFGQHIAREPARVWLYQYRAPSLTFYSRQPVASLGDTESLEQLWSDSRDGWLVIDAAAWNSVPRHATAATVVDASGRMLLVRLHPPPLATRVPD